MYTLPPSLFFQALEIHRNTPPLYTVYTKTRNSVFIVATKGLAYTFRYTQPIHSVYTPCISNQFK